ncbi:hypothetical protein BpHYR1_019423 [Brachionus plicatilis]|uniref:Uncharacterized protein n=1 Tax=Brachionus plicatilis TaxID=10195 RepID=A0A3M7RE29_BRAPC|nr:hypothetical protein BpHYR1_019423 [Brachionus plicatilis]
MQLYQIQNQQLLNLFLGMKMQLTQFNLVKLLKQFQIEFFNERKFLSIPFRFIKILKNQGECKIKFKYPRILAKHN